MLEFRTEAVRDFLDAVHVAFPASAKTGILESHTDSLRQQPFRKTDGWQAGRARDGGTRQHRPGHPAEARPVAPDRLPGGSRLAHAARPRPHAGPRLGELSLG